RFDIDPENHDIAHGHRGFDLAPHGAVELVVRARHHPARVHQPKPLSVPLGRAKMPIARDSRTGVHDRIPASDEPVEQRRFADVGPADDRDGGGAPHPCPTPNAERGSGNAEREAGAPVPRSAFRVPSSPKTSAKSCDRCTGMGTRAASSSAPTSSMKTRSSFTDSPGSKTKSRSVRPARARSIAAAGKSPAVVTD